MSEPKQPHDALFKKTFSVVEHAAAELRAVLPAALTTRIEFPTLALCSGSYIDEALSGSQSDLLFSAQISGKSAFIYVLFEHQSSPDKLMPLRLLSYVVRILVRHTEQTNAGSDPLPLPVVIPVVLHHGESGWSVATRLEDLFDQQLIAETGIAELIPRLSFVLDDLGKVTDDELERRALGLLPTLTLWAFRDVRNPARLARSLWRWVAAMTELGNAPNGREALWTILRYIAVVADTSVATTFSEAIAIAQTDMKDESMTTIAEMWEAQGEARGRAEGEARGRAEGKADTLRKLLTLRFGELSEATELRLAHASESELDRWVERVLTANSLGDAIGD
jgi:predicted transposase/invertase (TIGR01784 family)